MTAGEPRTACPVCGSVLFGPKREAAAPPEPPRYVAAVQNWHAEHLRLGEVNDGCPLCPAAAPAGQPLDVERIIELARDWKYSDTFIGQVVRSMVPRDYVRLAESSEHPEASDPPTIFYEPHIPEASE